MIGDRTIVLLSLSQFLCWGISYYMIGVFGPAIAADTGWALTLVYSGFSGALVVMGLVSGIVGDMIDKHGGRAVMTTGSGLMAVAFVGLGLSESLLLYDVSWALLGIAMRMTLYEAAFATLARAGGAGARRSISKVTLLGGLSSAAFWPVGDALVASVGWRHALFVYALLALVGMALHWMLPSGNQRDVAAQAEIGAERACRPRIWPAAFLFTVMSTLSAFINSGLSAHMLGIFSGLGLAAGTVVIVSSLRGIGQSLARLWEVAFGGKMSSFRLGVIAAAGLPLAFAIGLAWGGHSLGAAAFALTYGLSIGLFTIVRGVQPLQLFDPSAYGRLSGWMLAPAFFASALAPLLYAGIIESQGSGAALRFSLILAFGTFISAVLISQLYGQEAQ
ncbi:MFS transporter [Sinorhizobium garamanticum]|uniref:MFS transporter n=1 Tax=Sinorhizobium garamanticum TaxID=680247 RepID=A0ABY8DG90_9HYPH|nr:MFS transporter [Sinorhizobium garamanticum]WEX89904.1 MFS transporter [Sinorhizobium garamanticum]